MIATCVHVQLKSEHVAGFIEACRKNHLASVSEPGNIRFDILQSKNEPTRFMLYEAFSSEEAAAAHKQTDHYFIWKDTVAPYMAKPRQGDPFTMLMPEK